MKLTNCKIIGLTGGIASGKSTVSNILREKGFKVIEADKIARKVVEEGKPAYKEITDFFGDSILNIDKSINRQALGDIVFSNKELLKQLNRITHPKIYAEIRRNIKNLCQKYETIFVDIPLLFEELENINKNNIYFHQVWLVYVDENIQVDRLMKRNGLGLEKALERIKLQIPLAKKMKMADIVIDNSKNIESLSNQIDDLIEGLG